MGDPLELMYSWQALLLALSISGTMQFIKTLLDIQMGKPKREAHVWLNRIWLPALTILLGACYANFIPLRPSILTEYIKLQDETWTEWNTAVMYAVWGGSVGQFADYAYTKFKKILEAGLEARGARRDDQ